MKKSVLFGFLIILLILNVSFIIAVGNETDDKAYECLEGKVEGRCSSLSSGERIFSLLAIGECKDKVSSDLDDGYNGDIKLTAQAILALDKAGVDTSEAEEWLLSQNTTPENMEWLLQIVSEATTCTITYGESDSDEITIYADYTLSISGSSFCFTLTGYGIDYYWLEISQDCYDYEFEITCGESFSTNLLSKKTTGSGSDITYVSADTSSGGTTTEKVNSFCFSEDGNTCDYESSLWAAIGLHALGYETSSYLPYLITMADDYNEYFPESFLCILRDNFCNELLSKQLSGGFWEVLGGEGKYYDTALALLAFQDRTNEQKTKTKNWLSSVQGNDGCWNNGHIRDTAFLLYSIWPRGLTVPDGDEGVSCGGEVGGYCIHSVDCERAEGKNLGDEYSCFSASDVCCNKDKPLDTCSKQEGKECDSGEECSSSPVEASDTSECCLGTCRTPSEESGCELYEDGSCRTSCYSYEEITEDYDCDAGDVCCVEKEPSEAGSYWWIWVLLVLIILVVMGIIFKDKLRPIWFKIKSKFGKFKPKHKPGPRPGFPPARPGMPPQRVMPRRILPPAQRKPVRRPVGKPKKEMADVLKKLKEMGK